MGFKPLTLNTPAADKAHIFAEDDAAIYQSIIGEDGVFNIGEQFKATVLSNNKVRISNGVLNVQGHVGRTEFGDYTDMTIENGESGKNRNDLIVARFAVGTDADSFGLAVKKGIAGTTAIDPAITQGDLYGGSKLRELPLWRVKIEGLSIVAVEKMFTVNPTNKDLLDKLDALNNDFKNVNTFYKKSGSVNAIKNQNVSICDLTIPRGIYLVLALTSVNITEASSIISCTINSLQGAPIVLAGGITTTTTMEVGGGTSSWVLLECTRDTTLKVEGYGYSNKEYVYKGHIAAIRLK